MSVQYTDSLPVQVAIASIVALGKQATYLDGNLEVKLPSGMPHVFHVTDPLRRRDVAEIARRLKVEPHLIWHHAQGLAGSPN